MAAPLTDMIDVPAADRLDTRNFWPRPRRIIWFGIVGGPLAWGLQLTFGWLIEGVSCRRGIAAAAPWFAEIRLLQWIVVAVCLAIVSGALAVAVSTWRTSGRDGKVELQALGRPNFLSAIAVIASSIFLLSVVWTALAQVWLPPCASIRRTRPRLHSRPRSG